ncbi:MAG TPA: zf-TFIIB domain-containing protein [Geobacteraceae bacterium]
MANCSSCSAPLPPNSIQCEYCGSRNDIDLKGVHYNTNHECESERICPRCNVRLETIDLKIDGKFLIERCETCLGLFFDPGELEALLQATVSNVFTVDRGELDVINRTMRAADYGVSYIKCPVCTKIMNRVNFGAKSGVIVDRCREHGVWLDGGELRHLFEWMKAGGKILDQERQEQLKKDAAAENRCTAPVGEYRDYTDFGAYGGTLRNEDADLFDLVLGAIRFFTR